MRVKVRVFAGLRDQLGAGQIERDLPDGASVADLWERLASQHPAIARYRGSVSAAVNEEFARMTTTLSDGDEVAFLPPVSGG